MATKQYPYTTPANYTYDSDKIEVSGGLATLKEDLTNVYARWHLNEDTGLTVLDTSGNGRDGTPVNSPVSVAGKYKLNNCLQFNGTTQYVNLGNIGNFERTDSFSIEGWVKLAVKGIIIGREQWVSPYRGWYVGTNPSGWLQFVLTNTWGTNQLSVYQDAVNMLDNAWHHFIITYDGLSNNVGVKFYVDDILRTTKGSASTLTATIQNTKNCQIDGVDGANELVTGLLDEILIYDKELTPEEVTYKWKDGDGRENVQYYSDKPTIEPTSLFDPTIVISWDSFLETLGEGNQGSIGYNLYKVDEANRYYWNGSAWVTGGSSSNYNSQAVINTNIGTFDGSPDKIGFIAYLISDGEQVVELDENQITYTITLPPSVNAGSNKVCKDHENIKPFSDAVISDPDGDIENATAWYDIEGSGWTQIPKGGYGTLQEAIREWQYTFDNLGTVNCKLKIIDEHTAESEDDLDVVVSKYTKTVNIKDSVTDEHLSTVLFDPGDGTSPAYKNSPFTYSWEYGSFDIVMEKTGYYTKSQTISISDETDLDLTLIEETVLNRCVANIGLITETDTLTVCVWLEIDGQIVDNPISCEIWLYDSDAVLKYHPTVNTVPNVFGAFHFKQSPSTLADDEVYCLRAKITANGNEYVSVINAGQIRKTDLILQVLPRLIENLRPHHTGTGNIYYWNPYGGNDSNDGKRPERAVKTFAKAQDLVTDYNHDVIIGIPGNPAGITITDEVLTITKHSLFIRAPGRDFRIKPTSTTQPTITIVSGARGIEISGMVIETADSGGQSAVKINGRFVLLKNLWVDSASGDGVEIDNARNAIIDECRVINCGKSGIKIGNNVDDTTIQKSHIDDNVEHNINLAGSNIYRTILEDNIIRGAGQYGLNIGSGADKTLISGNNKFANNTSGDILDNGTNTSNKITSDLVKRILGLTQENYRIFNPSYDGNNLVSATIKIYPSKADCDADTNVLATYSMVATYSGVKMDTYKVTKE